MTHPHHAYACCTHNIALIILIINEVVDMYFERDNKRVLKGVTMELGLASGELTRGTFDGLGMRTGSFLRGKKMVTRSTASQELLSGRPIEENRENRRGQFCRINCLTKHLLYYDTNTKSNHNFPLKIYTEILLEKT